MCRWLPVCAALLLVYAARAVSEDHERWYIVSMGDSITAGFNTRWPGDFHNARYNWSTGSSKRVDSHFKKLKKITSKDVRATNVAKSRATSHELALQWRRIETPTIDYLTLLIGANDVCSWTDEYTEDKHRFRDNVRNIIDKAIAVNTDVQILLAAIPNMYHLYEQGKNSCGVRWDYFEACPSLLSSRRTDAQRLAFQERLLAANETLAAIASHYRANVKFIGEVFAFEFTMQHVSRIDCFHPSIRGQNTLARITWENGWYR